MAVFLENNTVWVYIDQIQDQIEISLLVRTILEIECCYSELVARLCPRVACQAQRLHSRIASASIQVMPDWTSEVGEAIAVSDTAAVLAEADSWEAKAAGFWRDTADDWKAKPKLQRKKAKQWLVATDSAMKVSTGMGWADFIPPTDKPADDIASSPTASVSVDQGSDGWSALMWLIFYSKAAIFITFDPMHRLWNDVGNEIKSTNLWPVFFS